MIKPAKLFRELMKTMVSRPATIKYPYERREVARDYRGRILFTAKTCIGCKICERDCPSNAIKIIRLENDKCTLIYKSALAEKVVELPLERKDNKKFKCVIDLGKCLFCAQCVESCPKKSLSSSANYELAVLDPKNLTDEQI